MFSYINIYTVYTLLVAYLHTYMPYVQYAYVRMHAQIYVLYGGFPGGVGGARGEEENPGAEGAGETQGGGEGATL